MGKSQETFNKKEKEKKKRKKREEKLKKKEERKSAEKGGMDDMIAYVDEHGNITDTPPDPEKKKTNVKAEDIVVGIPKKEEQEPEDIVRKGKVTFFNDSKGYGFIKDEVSQESVFVHANGLIDEIAENDKVTFEIEKGQRGPQAVKVTLV